MGWSLVRGVEGAPLVPLHVTDATHGLHLGMRGPKVTAVLVISLLQQVLQPTVARVLVANPPAAPEVRRGDMGKREGETDKKKEGRRNQNKKISYNVHICFEMLCFTQRLAFILPHNKRLQILW